MAKLKLFQKVIVSDHGVKKVGIVTATSIKQKKRVYNVRMENGTEFLYLSIDNEKSDYYIDSSATQRFVDQINTNLNIHTLKNSQSVSVGIVPPVE